MPDRLTDQIAQLVETWRKRASEQGAIYASGIFECADELAALLATHQAPDPVRALIEADKLRHTGAL